MKGPTQAVLRRLTQVTRPLAMRSAGTETSRTSIIRHVGRRSGRSYETPVAAVEHDNGFLIALPYGERTDWMKNVVAGGAASVVSHGRTFRVDQPRVVPMAEMTAYFGPKEQKLHRRFAVTTCLWVRHDGLVGDVPPMREDGHDTS
jgi:deazaflavin-dependent oxidoreductase (nitroreductase family)